MRAVVDPTESELRSMREGDLARLAPKGAKCDSFGTCHGTDGTEPIVLPFHDQELNAARWLRDIELHKPCRGTARNATALFGDENGDPYTDARFSTLIMALLTHVLGGERAALLSPHSWRGCGWHLPCAWLAPATRAFRLWGGGSTPRESRSMREWASRSTAAGWTS